VLRPRVIRASWFLDGFGGAAGAVPVVVSTASQFASLFLELSWYLFRLGLFGAVATRLLPWSWLELPGPLGTIVGLVYTVLNIYGAGLLRVLNLLFALGRAFLRGLLDSSLVGDSADAATAAACAGPAWSELEQVHAELGKVEGNQQLPLVFNPTRSSLRLFGTEERDVRVVYWRDSAAWCPYCMKTQLFLEESRIPYRVEWVNMMSYGSKPTQFLRMNPRGLLPVMEVADEVITDSDRIISRLEQEHFAGSIELLPPTGDPRRSDAVELIGLSSRVQQAWLSWLRSPVNDGVCKQEMIDRLDEVEEALACSEIFDGDTGPFLLGSFSLVECHMAPVLERAAASLAYFKGFFIRKRPDDGGSEGDRQGKEEDWRRWPLLQRWFTALEERPSYQSLSGDFYTHAHDLPPQLGSCARNGRGDACEAHVDGLPGSGAWCLPLPDIDPFEPLPRDQGMQAARLEAAEALLRNRTAVTAFALRALAPPGLPPVGATLADPNAAVASPGDGSDWILVDCALRHVVALLLHHGGAAVSRHHLPAELFTGGEGVADRWRECLRYLQQRVGVPRDMGAAAARQLRAHIGAVCAA